jgi:archaellum biogenesis ATPase FlaH
MENSNIPNVKIESLPKELKDQCLFCCWKYEDRKGRKTKMPYDPKTGERARSNDPATFAPLQVAEQALTRGYDGLGVGIFGTLGAIDIDHCIQDEQLSDMAVDIGNTMDSYIERSPSGEGLRILFWAKGFHYDKDRYYINNQKLGLEVYIAGCTQKYVTVTGNRFLPSQQIEERSEQLRQVLERYMVRNQTADERVPKPNNDSLFSPPTPNALTDDDLLQRARNAKNGDRFWRLWEGDWSDYPSQSEADQALCNQLAFWTGKDPQRMDSLFRQSGLMRKKWDRKQSGSTYGGITIQNAIKNCKDTYTGKREQIIQPSVAVPLPAPAQQEAQKQGLVPAPATSSTPTQPHTLFKTLDKLEERDATWVVPNWIPEKEITLIAADGGTGKTTLWCNLVAGFSSGRPTFLDPEDTQREPMSVMILSTEDDVQTVLKKKIRLNGADFQKIIAPDIATDTSGQFNRLKFGSPELAEAIRTYRPKVCIFDPIQGFTPPDVNMSARNQMRNCLNPLRQLGQEVGTTFLLICHTNKKTSVSGRGRVSDSSDLWDFARSVIMMGSTEDREIKYISLEKHSYCGRQDTLLCSIRSDGTLEQRGTTEKQDGDFVTTFVDSQNSTPKKGNCMDLILNILDDAGGEIESDELLKKVKNCGFSKSTFERSRKALKEDGTIGVKSKRVMKGGQCVKRWYVTLCAPDGELTELPDDMPTPFDEVTGEQIAL